MNYPCDWTWTGIQKEHVFFSNISPKRTLYSYHRQNYYGHYIRYNMHDYFEPRNHNYKTKIQHANLQYFYHNAFENGLRDSNFPRSDKQIYDDFWRTYNRQQPSYYENQIKSEGWYNELLKWNFNCWIRLINRSPTYMTNGPRWNFQKKMSFIFLSWEEDDFWFWKRWRKDTFFNS